MAIKVVLQQIVHGGIAKPTSTQKQNNLKDNAVSSLYQGLKYQG